MHKNIPVVDIMIDPDSGYIDKIGALHNPAHLPIGTAGLSSADRGRPNRAFLNDWWTGRSIPASRDKIEAALCVLDLRTPAALIIKCYGLSLSDQYWVKPAGSDLTWNIVNFFENDFSKDIGEILFGYKPEDLSVVNMSSPDNTMDGWLCKKWVVKNGKRVLIKGGSGVFEQEPFNEVIAASVMRRLGIPHVPYELVFDSGKAYSLCENFVTAETELIPAWRVVQTSKRLNSDSELSHLLRCCDGLGIPDVTEAIDKMLTLDYIIANEDRHYNNFGFLRNADTLEWLGLAPIFDSGTSLWHNARHIGSLVESKPFKKTHAEQMSLVRNLKWFDYDALRGIDLECSEILAKSSDIEPERCRAIANAVFERSGMVEIMRINLHVTLTREKMKAHKNIVKQTPKKKHNKSRREEPDL